MHEFALAEDIIGIIQQKVVEDLAQISAIYIDVGVYAGVVNESLELGLQVLAQQGGAADVKIHIHSIPAQVRCECGHHYKLDDVYDVCPKCSSFNRAIISGADVIINSVEVRDNNSA